MAAIMDTTGVMTGEVVEIEAVIAEVVETGEITVAEEEIAETNSAMCKWRDGSIKMNCAIEQLRNFQIITNVTA
jgi:hypothetical protein